MKKTVQVSTTEGNFLVFSGIRVVFIAIDGTLRLVTTDRVIRIATNTINWYQIAGHPRRTFHVVVLVPMEVMAQILEFQALKHQQAQNISPISC